MAKYAAGTQGVESRLKKTRSKLYSWKDCFLKFKGTPSRGEHKKDFCVLTTTKIENWTCWSNSNSTMAPYLNLVELRTMSCELQAMSYELRATATL
jgi:hypothetical protein